MGRAAAATRKSWLACYLIAVERYRSLDNHFYQARFRACDVLSILGLLFLFGRETMKVCLEGRIALLAMIIALVIVPAAIALCYQNVNIVYDNGTEVHCSSFCTWRGGWSCEE
jgi:hypothetical protein